MMARLAQPIDRPALADLQVRAWRRHGVLAVEDQIALLNSGFSTLAFAHERAIGFLGLHLREPTEDGLWVDAAMVTLASGVTADRMLARLLQAALPGLRTRRVTGVVCLTAEAWLRDALLEIGFKEVDQVITYTRHNQYALPPIRPVATLRPAGPAEADTFLRLNAAAFHSFWRYDAATTLSWLFSADHAVLAERDGQAVGFALTSHASGNSYDQLIRLATHPDAQGQGVGRQMVADAIAFSRQMGSPGVALNTQLSNTVSRHLYEALDFHVSGAAVRVLSYPVR